MPSDATLHTSSFLAYGTHYFKSLPLSDLRHVSRLAPSQTAWHSFHLRSSACASSGPFQPQVFQALCNRLPYLPSAQDNLECQLERRILDRGWEIFLVLVAMPLTCCRMHCSQKTWPHGLVTKDASVGICPRQMGQLRENMLEEAAVAEIGGVDMPFSERARRGA